MKAALDQRHDHFISIIDECVRSGRRRSEVAAFLAREYGLDAMTIAGLVASHGASRARRSITAAVSSAYVACVGFAQRHEQVDVPFLTFI